MKRCRCGHDESRHELLDAAAVEARFGRRINVPPGHQLVGPCAVSLPPFEEEELPAWHCPCTRYAPGRLVRLAELELEAS